MPQEPESLMYGLLKKIKLVNKLAIAVLDTGFEVFKEVSLPHPRLQPPELGFIRTVSWLYVTFHESGKIGVEFLSNRFEAYEINRGKELSEHRTIVRQLRTYEQHYLNPSKPHDESIQRACEAWFTQHCRTSAPTSDIEWITCLTALLQEAQCFVDALVETIREIEKDESREEICRQWKQGLLSYYPPEEFVDLVQITATDMGRKHLNAGKFVNKHYESWAAELEYLETGFDFDIEARRLIEHSILSNPAASLPITGKDVMDALNIEPGPLVGQKLQEAREAYLAGVHNKEALIQTIRAQEDGSNFWVSFFNNKWAKWLKKIWR